jgi:hypothetical protein
VLQCLFQGLMCCIVVALLAKRLAAKDAQECACVVLVLMPSVSSITRIRRRHCRVSKITRKHSTLVMKGRVISQHPRASSQKRKNGFKVNLTVGKGPSR